MKQTVYLDDFRQAFKNCGREKQFSYEGLEILFNWIEQIDSDTGTESELDVIALCCEFNEMYYLDIASSYDIDIEGLNEVEARNVVIDYIQENSQFCGLTRDDDIVFMTF
jgi:hypothetical protein